MDAFIAREKYIVKEHKPGGIGVSVTCDEDVAKYESTRRKNVDSYNSWLSISIPDRTFFLDAARPMREQSEDVLSCINKKEFLTTLFATESRKLYKDMDELVKDEDSNDAKLSKSKSIFTEFLSEKYNFLLGFSEGIELFDFICRRCRNHDLGKSSALLYDCGIKGSLFSDDTGERLLLYNAAKDIVVLNEKSMKLPDSRQIL